MLDLLSIELKDAFQQRGCPICYLRLKVEARYIYSILYEYVTDGGVRVQFVNSLGYCRKHAWQMQGIEFEHWHDGLGTATMYESVLQGNLAGLNKFIERTRPQVEAAHSSWPQWLTRLRKRFHRTFDGAPRQLPFGLIPRARCRVCEMGTQCETWYIPVLAEKLVWEQFREWYRQSDGLCLPHLNGVLPLVPDPMWRAWLIELAVQKLGANASDLGEFLRKRNYRFHDELVTVSESTAFRRAVEQFTGNLK